MKTNRKMIAGVMLAVAFVAVASFCMVSSDVDSEISVDLIDTTYLITFDPDGGTSDVYKNAKESFQVKGGSNSIELPVTTWTKDGNYLTGWKSTASGKTYALSETFTPNCDDTLTAVWAEYPSDTHLSGMDKILAKGEEYHAEYTIDSYWAPITSSMDLKAPTGISGKYTRSDLLYIHHYEFEGQLSNPGVYIVSMVNSTYDHNRNWWVLTVPSNFDTTCTVEFYTDKSLNTSLSGTAALSGPMGTAITLPDGAKSGYVLKGWRINDGAGSSPLYAQGSTYTLVGDKKAWKEESGEAHVAIFIIDGGDLNVDGFVTYTDEGFTLLGTDNVKAVSGKTFIGWQQVENKTATGPLYAPGLTMSTDKTMIFHACYIDSNDTNTYQVTFDPGEGTGKIVQTVKAGMSVYLPTEYQVSRPAYNFTGWSVNGSSTIYNGGTSYLPTDDVTFVANWKAQTVAPKYIQITGSSILRLEGTLTLYAETTGDDDAVRGAKFRITSGNGTYATITEQNVTNTGGYCVLSGLKTGSITIEAYSIADSALKTTKTVEVRTAQKTYGIYYDANEGTNAPDPTTTKSDNSGVTLKVTYAEPTRAGYSFDGWNDRKDGSGDKYPAGTFIALTDETGKQTKTLYAQWTKNAHTYSLTYELGKNELGETAPGSIKPESKSADGDTVSYKFTVTTSTPGWVGYKFLGWSYDFITAGAGDEDDVDAKPGQEITVSRTGVADADSTTEVLYAVWADNHVQYALTLDSNGGDSENVLIYKTDVVFSLNVQIPLGSDPVKAGSEFIGWTETGEAVFEKGEKFWYAGDYVEMNADSTVCEKTLYAVWSDGKNSHSITFDENSDGDKVEDMPKTASAVTEISYSTITVPDNIPTRQTSGDDFYIFAGWMDDKENTYYPGQEVKTPTNLEFKAIWMPFNLEMHSGVAVLTNGGAAVGVEVYIDWGDETMGSMKGGQTTLVHSYTVARSYDIVVQLSLSSSDGQNGLDASVIRSVTVGGAAGSYTVTYHSNDGKGDVHMKEGQTIVIASNMFTAPSGKVFAAWNTESDGSGDEYAPGSSKTLTADLNLYAQWKQTSSTSYTITYHSNDGTNKTETQTGTTVTVKDCMFAGPSGKEFASWNDKANGTGNKYAVGASQALSGNLDLYAQWKDIPVLSFVITYHSNDGKNGSVVQSGDSVIIKGCMFDAQSGKKFVSWNTKADGTGDEYEPGQTKALTSDIHLYAQWTDSGSGDDGGAPVWAIAATVAVVLIAGFVIVRWVI